MTNNITMHESDIILHESDTNVNDIETENVVNNEDDIDLVLDESDISIIVNVIETPQANSSDVVHLTQNDVILFQNVKALKDR